MDITQTFYDYLAPQYDKLFLDWKSTTQEQAQLLSGLFSACGFDTSHCILDCACGIGTQSIGLASLGYPVTASDLSTGALTEARQRADSRMYPFALPGRTFVRWRKPLKNPLIL